MENLTVIIPFFNGHNTAHDLISSIPKTIPIIVVDDLSDALYQPKPKEKNVSVIYSSKKGYFTGAVNLGIDACRTDVLILNQDTVFENNGWLDVLKIRREKFGMIGERIGGDHPAWKNGYIHGTFMFLRRDVIDKVGKLNSSIYPLWGSTCEYQLRVARAGFEILKLQDIPGFIHRRGGRRYGESISEMLQREPQNRQWFLHTPPEVSVIIPCYKQGRFLKDAINSLIGGDTCLGTFAPQTFQSFEVIIVDDVSPDNTQEIAKGLISADKGIRYIRRNKNGGTPAANNTGIEAAFGRYVTILCADDMMETNRLQTMYDAAQKDPSKVYYDDMRIFNQSGRTDTWIMPEYNFKKLLYKNHMHAGIFFLKDTWRIVGGYPEIMREGREDWAMNVRLGAAGYCGKHVDNTGYLYRRQDHNRTLTNTTSTWRAKFLAQIQSLYPQIYRGEYPEMCCGNTPTKSSSAARGGKIMSSQALPMTSGAVVLEYIGTSILTQTFYGQATGSRYAVGKTRPLVAVDPRDARTGNNVKKGLLELIEKGKPLFRVYSPPKPTSANSVARADSGATEPYAETQRDTAPVLGVPVAENVESVSMETPVDVEKVEVSEEPAKKTRAKKKKTE